MSAFMCDNVVFEVLVAGGFEYGLIQTKDQGQVVGQMLATENGKSIAYRYADAGPEETNPTFELTTVTEGRLNVYALLKAMDCWGYQTCEHPTYTESEAYAWVETLRSKIKERHPDLFVPVPTRWGGGRLTTYAYKEMPAYDSAPGWGFDDTFSDFIES